MAVRLSLKASADLRRALTEHWPLCALTVGLLIWFAPWLIAAEPRMGGDVTLEHYPRLAYAVAQLRAGTMPLWASLTMGGVPLLANPQLALFYPLNWLGLTLLPVGAALNYAAVLHVSLAAFTTYALARRWALSPAAAAFAATGYAFNTLFAARLWAGQVGIVALAAWLPGLLLAADGLRARPSWRAGGALTGVLALSLLVGAYQSWFLDLLVVGTFLAAMPGQLRERLQRLAALAVAGLLSAGLAAPQLLPAAELVRWSVRAGRLDWAFATDASLPPWHLPTLLLPELFGSGAGTYWPGAWWHWHELTAYAGLLPLVLLPLGLLRPREAWVRYCAALAGVTLLLALGRYTPVYGWLYDWAPGYASFRDPGRHLIPGSLALALLAGRGADRLLAGRGYRPVTIALLALVALGALGAVVALRAADNAASAVVPFLTSLGVWQARPETAAASTAELGGTVLLLAARACGMAVLAAAVALIGVVLARRGPPARRATLLLMAVYVDLSAFGWRYLHEPLPLAPGVPFASPEAQFATLLGAENVARLQQSVGLARVAVLGREGAIAANAGYLLGIPMAMGLDPLLPRRYAELVARIDGQPVEAFEQLVLYLDDQLSPLWPLLSAPYRLVPSTGAGTDRAGAYNLQGEDNTFSVLPRIQAMSDVQLAAAADDSLAALGTFDPARTVVLEAPASALAAAGPAASTDFVAFGGGTQILALRQYAPGDLTVGVNLPGRAAVVVLEAWHPGWRATVDGQDTAVYPADHAFMGVLVPPGRHEVRLRFQPLSFTIGVVLGLTTGAAVALVGILVGIQHARRQRAVRAA
ncbi:MAG TPA: YfhO family protein [Chloroflexota bacterium]|nr:YfhO family protein [Chloroflexota bacterium]